MEDDVTFIRIELENIRNDMRDEMASAVALELQHFFHEPHNRSGTRREVPPSDEHMNSFITASHYLNGQNNQTTSTNEIE